MNKLILNRVAIWQKKGIDGFTVKPSPAGRVYFENNIAKTSDKLMFRYGKNYSVGKGNSAVKFCLFIMTFSDSAAEIEIFLDEVAKAVDVAIAQKAILMSSGLSFEYLDAYYKGEK